MGLYKILKSEYGESRRFWFFRLLFVSYWSPEQSAVIYYRIANYYWKKDKKWKAKYFSNKITRNVGCYINEKAQIGKNLQLKHANGVVVGEGVVIGDNVKIYHQVTLGGKNVGDSEKGNYPQVGNSVTIFAGAKLAGDITIGEHAVIGANSVVIRDVEPYSVYAGIPAKRIK